MTDALTASGGKLKIAIESERVHGALTEQTPKGFPRAHLREKKRSGAEDERKTEIVLERLVPKGKTPEESEALLDLYRHQQGFNKLVSPWIVAIADPRGSVHYAWPAETTTDKKTKLGCIECNRPLHLKNRLESANVYEIYTNGRLVAVPSFTATTNRSHRPRIIRCL